MKRGAEATAEAAKAAANFFWDCAARLEAAPFLDVAPHNMIARVTFRFQSRLTLLKPASVTIVMRAG